jgi:hypothetical protein
MDLLKKNILGLYMIVYKYKYKWMTCVHWQNAYYYAVF